MSKLFISHAASDKPLVEAVVDLLESGVGIPHESIFCSSLKGQSIAPGVHFVESIRQSLEDATCVLALISEAYYASAFCMCELGGVWLASKSFLPVLVPPLDYADLKAVLGGLQVSKLAREDDLDELHDELLKRLSLEGYSTPRWSSKRQAFLGKLPDLLSGLAFEGPVARDKYDHLLAERDTYRMEYESLEAKFAETERLVSDLKGTKDATLVASIVRAHSSTSAVFEDLTSTAASALRRLPEAVREALYYRVRGEDYFPSSHGDWDAIQRSVEYGQLEVTSEGKAVAANENDPRVREASAALRELERWLREPPDDFFEWYEHDTGGERPKLSLRLFWDRHLR